MEGHLQLLVGPPLHPIGTFPLSMLAYTCLDSTDFLLLTTLYWQDGNAHTMLLEIFALSRLVISYCHLMSRTYPRTHC